MALVAKKIAEIESRIHLASAFVDETDELDQRLDPYVAYIKNQLADIRNRLQETKSDLSVLVDWHDFTEDQPLQEMSAKHQYSNILQSLSNIESAFYFRIDSLLPLLKSWITQKNDHQLAHLHSLANRFTLDMATKAGIDQTPIALFLNEYFTYSCYYDRRIPMGHIVAVPFSERSALRRWVILAHEIGHAYFDFRSDLFERQVNPIVSRAIHGVNANSNQVRSAEDIWITRWIPEMVSDCVAIHLVGPSYTLQFITDALQPNPIFVDLRNPTHPPMGIRVDYQLKLLRKLNLQGFDLTSLTNLWDAYRRNIVYQVDPIVENLLLELSVTQAAEDKIDEVVSIRPIQDEWGSIASVKKALQSSKLPDATLFSYFCALALLPHNFEIHRVLEKFREGAS